MCSARRPMKSGTPRTGVTSHMRSVEQPRCLDTVKWEKKTQSSSNCSSHKKKHDLLFSCSLNYNMFVWKAPFKFQPPERPLWVCLMGTCSCMGSFFFLTPKAHFSVTFRWIKRPTRDKRQSARMSSGITNVVSSPAADDSLIVSVYCGFRPITCTRGHATIDVDRCGHATIITSVPGFKCVLAGKKCQQL